MLTRIAAAVFVSSSALCAYWGLNGRTTEVTEAIGSVSPWELGLATALVIAGLLATSRVWSLLMKRLEAPLPGVDGLAIFFVGQLGKYIPGSVWAIGAQAVLARSHCVGPRTTFTAGLTFLGYHVTTAGIVASIPLLAGWSNAPWPTWATALVAGVCIVFSTPPVVRQLTTRVVGSNTTISWTDTGLSIAWMMLAWTLYSAALVLLTPNRDWSTITVLGGAFALSYAIGVIVVIAPAGLGARDGVFLFLLTPIVGLGPATGLALLSRVIHTISDVALAAIWWTTAWRRRPTAPHRSQVSSDL